MFSRFIPLVLILLLALGAILVVERVSARTCKNGCNVILIMVDTLSARHIKTYGYDRDTMPKTTAFFEQGIIFEDAMSNATWTLPSFTGMYFSDIASRITYKDLAERTRPHLQGELRERGITLRVIRVPHEIFIMDGIYSLFNGNEMVGIGAEGRLPFEAASDVLSELEKSEAPFFLLVHTFEAHGPFRPQPPFNEYFEHIEGYENVTTLEGRTIGLTPTDEDKYAFRLRYDQQIAQTDTRIAGFLNSLDEQTLADTVIILTSDHGEAFGEHEKMWHANAPFQEEIHIPLMMRIPGVSPRRIEEPVSLLDIAPTVLSLFRIPVPDTFIGEDVTPLIAGQSLRKRVIPFVTGHPFFLSFPVVPPLAKTLEEAGALGADRPIVGTSSWGVRQGDNKIFHTIRPEEQAGAHWYNLRDDPDEKNNLMGNGAGALPAELLEHIVELGTTGAQNASP